MGRLESKQTGHVVSLRPRHVVGRSSSCDLVLRDGTISHHHAELAWDGAGWRVRDLASKNGTTRDGAPLPAGESLALAAGSSLRFGQADSRWTLTDGDGPCSHAVAEGGELVDGAGLFLTLGEGEGTLTVHRRLDGSWEAERVDRVWDIRDREAVEVDGKRWTVHLPELLPATVEDGPSVQLDELSLRFLVSRDGENVELELEGSAFSRTLSSRAHHQLLLTLAEERLAHASANDRPETEHGWISKTRLQRLYEGGDNLVHLHAHRARRQLAELGVDAASRVVESRPGGKMRIGIGDLSVRYL